MRLAVGDVVELVGPDRAFGLFGEAARSVDEVPRIGELGGRHQHQFGAQRAQRVHLLARLVVGHDDHRLVAQRIGNQRDPDPGISRRAFHHRAAGLQHAARLGIADDPQGCAILHRPARVGKFALAVDIAARRRARPFEPDERGVADQVERPGQRGRRKRCGGSHTKRLAPPRRTRQAAKGLRLSLLPRCGPSGRRDRR